MQILVLPPPPEEAGGGGFEPERPDFSFGAHTAPSGRRTSKRVRCARVPVRSDCSRRPPAPSKTGRLALLQPSSEQELGEHLGTDSPPGPLSFLTSVVFGDLLFLLGGSNSLCKRIDACSFCRGLWQPVLPVNYLSSLSTLQRPPFEPCPPGQEPSRSPGRPAPGSSGSSVGGTCDVLSFSLTLALSYP